MSNLPLATVGLPQPEQRSAAKDQTTPSLSRRKRKRRPRQLGKQKTGSSSTPSEESTPVAAPAVQPKGATLDIGIPCLIFSERKRFRAFARYIGEVEGDTGPWVGVEVPVTGGGWDDQQQSDGRAWHDGSWGKILRRWVIHIGMGRRRTSHQTAS